MQRIMPAEKIRITSKGNIMLSKLGAKFHTGYVSEIDQFLQELNNKPGVKSTTRLDEEQKYKRIFALRDVPRINLPDELPWKEF